MSDKKTILIAEDNISNRIQLQEILNEQYDILLAQTSQDAVKMIQEYREDISAVILGVKIVEQNGELLWAQIKGDTKLPRIPLIISLDVDKVEEQLKTISIEAQDYILVPYKAPVVQTRIKNIILQNEIKNQYAPYYDKLTGIYSPQTFYEKTSELLKNNLNIQYVILRWNIERFKLINDIFGTKQGDEILVAIANGLRKNCSDGRCTFARLSSDHFGLCVPYELLDIGDIITKVDAFLSSFIENYKIVSNFGVYVIDDITTPVALMCDRANLAVDACKGNYTYPCAVYDDNMRSKMMADQEIIRDMEKAVEEKQFEVYYQPIVSVDTKQICGAEALVRWHHPKRGFISPAEFIPIFEKNGFISHLDYYVMEAVCVQLARWIASKKNVVPVAINLSRLTLYNPNFSEVVINMCEKYNLSPEFLELEITESTYTEDPVVLLATMEKLQKYGFKFSMDDFGSGYSSFNMLKDVPFDVLKIDLSFLENFESSARSGTIVSSIVKMAKWLNMPVIVEGVETKLQMEFLRSIGCDKMQGYYFSKPMPVAKFEALNEKTFAVSEKQMEVVKTIADFDAIFTTNEVVTKILNTIAGGIGIYEFKNSSELEVLKVNEGYYDVLGDNPSNLYDESGIFAKVITSQEAEMLKNACIKASLTKKAQKVRLRRQTQKGVIWLSINIQYLGHSGKNPILCFAFNDVTDIMQQKENQEKITKELQKQHERYRLIAKKTGTIVFEWDMQSDSWEYEEVAEEFVILKTNPTQFFNAQIPPKVVHYMDTPLVMDFFSAQNIYKEDITGIEVRLAKNDASFVWCHLDASFVKNESGEITRAIVTIKEIDEIIREQEKAKYQEKLYRLVNKSRNDVIFDLDVEQEKLYYTISVEDGSFHEHEITNCFSYIPNSSVIGGKSKEILVKKLDSIINGDTDKEVELLLNFAGKGERWYRINMETIIDSLGKVTHIVGRINDIQKEKDIIEQLSKDQGYLNALVAESLFAFEYNFETTKATLVHQTSKYQTDFLPYKNYIGARNQSTSIHPEDIDMVQKLFNNQSLMQSFGNGEKLVRTRYRIKDRYSNWVWVECSTYILKKSEDTALESLVYFKIVDSEKKAHDELVKKAQIDGISGLYNRITFEALIEEYMIKNKNAAAFLLIDIDNFKNVNDTLGHLTGDKVIKETAHVLKSIFRVDDIVGRIGGDEFCVLLKNISDKEMVKTKAMQISKSIKNISAQLNHKLEISASVGVYMTNQSDDFAYMYQKADKALYDAKELGKDRVEFFELEGLDGKV